MDKCSKILVASIHLDLVKVSFEGKTVGDRRSSPHNVGNEFVCGMQRKSQLKITTERHSGLMQSLVMFVCSNFNGG